MIVTKWRNFSFLWNSNRVPDLNVRKLDKKDYVGML